MCCRNWDHNFEPWEDGHRCRSSRSYHGVPRLPPAPLPPDPSIVCQPIDSVHDFAQPRLALLVARRRVCSRAIKLQSVRLYAVSCQRVPSLRPASWGFARRRVSAWDGDKHLVARTAHFPTSPATNSFLLLIPARSALALPLDSQSSAQYFKHSSTRILSELEPVPPLIQIFFEMGFESADVTGSHACWGWTWALARLRFKESLCVVSCEDGKIGPTGPGSARRSVTPSRSSMENPPTSSTNIHPIVKGQIVFLFSTLAEDNFERNQIEIRSSRVQLSEQHGIDTYLHFIRRLIVNSQARLSPSATPSAFELSTSLTFRLLIQETQRLARDPLLAGRFRDGIDKGEGELFRHFDLVRFSDRIGLRPLERLILAASIVFAPSRKELATQAYSIIRTEFDNAVVALCHTTSFEHTDLSPAQVAKLMSNLLSDPPPIPLPWMPRSARLSSHCCGSVQVCCPTPDPSNFLIKVVLQAFRQVVRALMRFNISDANPPRDSLVVEIMSTLGRVAAEGTTMCDVGALVRALSSFHVQLNWASVIKSFDWPDRHGVDTAILKLLIAILVNSARDAEPHAVTGFWTTCGLIPIVPHDQQLAKVIFTDPRPTLLNHAAALIRECLSSDPPVAIQGQFNLSIGVMTQLSQSGKANEEVNRLLDDLRGVRRRAAPEAPASAAFLMGHYLPEVGLAEKNFVPFITQLTKQGILKVEDVSSFFFRVCAESSVNSYVECIAAGDFDYAFKALDAMSRLDCLYHQISWRCVRGQQRSSQGPLLDEDFTCGPYRPITLKTYTARITEVQPHALLSDDNVPSLNVDVTLAGTLDPALVASLRIVLSNTEKKVLKSQEVPVAGAVNSSAVAWNLAWTVELWWPVGYGAQHLYTVSVLLLDAHAQSLDSSTTRVGFRRVELVQEPLQEPDQYGTGTTFLFEVNGVRMFMGGSNWVPADNFLTTIALERYRAWLTLLRDGNQNMDFQFACGVYPAHDTFVASVRKEAEDNVRRLRHHPALVLFCGNNEDYQMVLQWGDLRRGAPGRCGRANGPQPVPYHRGSPYGGKGWDTADPTVGDVDQWNMLGGKEFPYQDYVKLGGRFVSFERRFAMLMNEGFGVTEELATYVYNTQLMQSEAEGDFGEGVKGVEIEMEKREKEKERREAARQASQEIVIRNPRKLVCCRPPRACPSNLVGATGGQRRDALGVEVPVKVLHQCSSI
ncbi:hypothetical protein B0H11DRAFT_1912166 [Mycena galericulata]|nr:hypothetical protein B0H11DRAFT_1912166 [Mycena galericulata]